MIRPEGSQLRDLQADNSYMSATSALRPSSSSPVVPELAPVGSTPVPKTPVAAQTLDLFDVAVPAVPVIARKPATPPDGRAFVQAAIADIAERVKNGEPCRVVFDIDDTLSDSRGRTLEIARRWDEANGTSVFENLTLDGCDRNGYFTAKKAGLSKEEANAFDKFWKSQFFEPELAAFNLPMQEIIDLAKAAKDAGAEVRYLTGRTESERESTLGLLQRFGLPDADSEKLTMKPTLSTETGEYKAKTFAEWAKDGAHTGFFITESRRDVAAVQGVMSAEEVPCVLIDAAKEAGGHAVDPATPIYPSQTAPREPSLWGEVTRLQVA